MFCKRYAHSNTTKTIININVLDVRGRNLQRKLQEMTFINDERNSGRINLSHEIKNKASVTLTIALRGPRIIYCSCTFMYNRRASKFSQSEKCPAMA